MKIIDHSNVFLAEMKLKIDEILEEVKPIIVNSAKEIVPVVTGALKESIQGEVENNKLTVGSEKEYSVKVEMNKPYLRPALMNNIPVIKKKFGVD